MLKYSDLDSSIVEWLDQYAQRGYMTTDTSFIIRGWNTWLEDKSGILSGQVLGRSLFEVFPDLVSRQLDRIYRDALNGQVSVLAHRFHKYLLKLPASSDEGLDEMQQSALISPLTRDGTVIGTVSVIDDVSERVLRENELLAAREEAYKANEAKDRFIAVLAHDLRTPLAAIATWTRIVHERPGDQRLVMKAAEAIERSTTVQISLIEKVLDISRINAAKLELDIEALDLPEALHTTLETLDPLAESKGICIDRTMIPRDHRTAALDPKRFQQIIWNLISNALKFTPKGGTVRVSLEYAPEAFELTVADTGKGISADSLPHLFEPLWQERGSGGQGGLGLGLAIVRNLVELHCGSIRAESAGPDQGAVFIVRIPWSGPRAGESDSVLEKQS